MSENNELVIIELDKVRTIKFGIKAMKKLEKMFNCKLLKALEKMSDLSTDEAVKVLFIGLSWEDKDLTLEQLEDLLDEHVMIGDLLKKISDSIGASFGDVKNAQAVAVTQTGV